MSADVLQGRHAIVTGGSRGIGAAVAAALSRAGARVTVTGRDAATLQKVAAGLPAPAHAEVADVADPASVAAAFAGARARFGPVSILVNNAGEVVTMPVAKMGLDVWERHLRVNLTGTFVCTSDVLPDMLAAGSGRIVNVASTAALRGYAFVAAYAAAKHGVLGFTRSLALEVAKQGITVNAVCPGYVDTEIVRKGIATVVATTGRSQADALAYFTKQNPQQRLIAPAEVAATVLWLCGAEAAGVNGAAIPISGGEI